jgi:carbamate kinase
VARSNDGGFDNGQRGWRRVLQLRRGHKEVRHEETLKEERGRVVLTIGGGGSAVSMNFGEL